MQTDPLLLCSSRTGNCNSSFPSRTKTIARLARSRKAPPLPASLVMMSACLPRSNVSSASILHLHTWRGFEDCQQCSHKHADTSRGPLRVRVDGAKSFPTGVAISCRVSIVGVPRSGDRRRVSGNVTTSRSYLKHVIWSMVEILTLAVRVVCLG